MTGFLFWALMFVCWLSCFAIVAGTYGWPGVFVATVATLAAGVIISDAGDGA